MKYVTFQKSLFALSFFLLLTALGQAQTAPTSAAGNSADEYAIAETKLDCAEVNHLAYQSLERLGYQVVAETPATPTTAGVLKGTRPFAWGGQESVNVKIVCHAESVDVDARPDVPPCEQANRIARLAVEHLDYKVTEFTPAAEGKPGVVKGSQTNKPGVYIAIFCEGRMVTMDTSSDSPLLKNGDFFHAITDFRRGFYAVYMAQRKIVHAPATPAATNQLQVVMHPLSKADTKTALGVEVTTMLAVQVEIINPTKRSYQLDTEKIMLVSLAGDRVKPLPEKDPPFPVHALTNQSVAPGAKVKGYLYYQPGAYTGARGALVEEKSQEREGFEVPF
ncbi:MAG: hypothetical protein HY267_02185 [Deltaproteobacteria bacterium]|nr:hypothetical protein [Deltaproteobacteria bacterium]